MRVRYHTEGGDQIHSGTFHDFVTENALSLADRDLLLRVFFAGGVMCYGGGAQPITWVWECPRYEFVEPQGPDGEPEIESVYVDEVTDDNRHRIPAEHEVTPEPELARDIRARLAQRAAHRIAVE